MGYDVRIFKYTKNEKNVNVCQTFDEHKVKSFCVKLIYKKKKMSFSTNSARIN